jgi:hypothetical protein
MKRIEEEERLNGNGGNPIPMLQNTNETTPNEPNTNENTSLKADERATFNETPLRPTEKRKVLSPS